MHLVGFIIRISIVQLICQQFQREFSFKATKTTILLRRSGQTKEAVQYI